MIVNLKRLARSFNIAFSGLRIAVKQENSFRAGVFIALIMIFFMLYFPLSSGERATVILTIFLVLGMELMNTQVERMTDLIDPNHNLEIKGIKDLVAGAVLLAIVGAALVGYFIFTPYIIIN